MILKSVKGMFKSDVPMSVFEIWVQDENKLMTGHTIPLHNFEVMEYAQKYLMENPNELFMRIRK